MRMDRIKNHVGYLTGIKEDGQDRNHKIFIPFIPYIPV
jgi:hypothetical protein